MTKLNRTQNAIKQLEGGRFQKLCDQILFRKYDWENIHSLGSMEATDKTTKGIPDTYFFDNKLNKYILVMYGTREDATAKLTGDIEDAIKKSKLEKKEIKKIICCHTSSNILVSKDNELRKLAGPIELELIGIDTLAQTLLKPFYQDLALEYLNISKGTGQVLNLKQFIDMHDRSKTNASLGNKYINNQGLVSNALKILMESPLLLLVGAAGVGKTRLAVEVFKQLPAESNIICVKSNYQPAYQDVKDSLEENRINYLLLDDSNIIKNLKAITDMLILSEVSSNLRIIMTVRDYALNVVEEEIKDIEFKKIVVKKIDDDKIGELVENITGTLPRQIKERIEDLSKGNPRIAVLAAESIRKDGYKAIINVHSILESYYGKILKDNTLSKNELKTLFSLSFFKKIKLKDEEQLNGVFSLVGLTTEEFMESVISLNDKEFCDIFDNYVAKVTDQSLEDFIIYKLVIVDKEIKIEDIFGKLYPNYADNIVTSLNRINIINSDDKKLFFIITQIKKVWEHVIKINDKEKFLTQFSVLIPIEALNYSVEKIEEVKPFTELKFDQTDFEKNKNHKSIADPVIKILCSLASTEKYDSAGNLLIDYLEKRPDKIIEGYNAIIKYFGTELEWNDNFVKAKSIMNKLITIENKSKAIIFLTLKISEVFLEFRGSKVTSMDSRKVGITEYSLTEGPGLIDFRQIIISNLLVIYDTDDEEIRLNIEKILMNFPVYEVKNGFSEAIKRELKIIEAYFLKLDNHSLRQEIIISNFRLKATQLGLDYIPFQKSEVTWHQELYNVLTSRYIKDEYKDYNEYQEKRGKNIVSYFEILSEKLLKQTFDVVSLFVKDELLGTKNIDEGILILFEKSMIEKKEIYLKSLLNSKYVFLITSSGYYLENLSFENVKKILSSVDYPIPIEWRLSNLLRVKKLNEIIVKEINQIIKQAPSETFVRHTLIEFEKFIQYDNNILNELINRYNKSEIHINFFIPDYIKQDDADKLVNIFGIKKIKKIYIENLENSIDQSARIFNRIIIEKDTEFLFNFLRKVSESTSLNSFQQYSSHFKYFWQMEDSYYVMKQFMIFLIQKNELTMFGWIDSVLKDILETDKEKSINFIIKELQETEDKEYIISLFKIIDIFDFNTKLEYFRLLKEKNLTYEELIKIPVIPSQSSWSGSRVPLLDKNIYFIDNILDIFDDVHYIKYSKYLIDIKDRIQSSKKNELISDYIEDN